MVTIFQWLPLNVIPIAIWGLPDTWYIWWCHHLFTIFFSSKEHPFKFIQQLFWSHLGHNKKDQVQHSEWQAVWVHTSVEQCAPVSVSGFVFVFVFHFCHISARNVYETETIHWIYSVNIFIRSSQIELVLFHSWCIKRYPHLLEILFREPVKNYLADFVR